MDNRASTCGDKESKTDCRPRLGSHLNSIYPQVCGKPFEERTDSGTVDRRACTSVRERYEHDFVEFLTSTWRFSCSS